MTQGKERKDQLVFNRYADTEYEKELFFDKSKCMWWMETIDREQEYSYGIQVYNFMNADNHRTRLWYAPRMNIWFIEYQVRDRLSLAWKVLNGRLCLATKLIVGLDYVILPIMA